MRKLVRATAVAVLLAGAGLSFTAMAQTPRPIDAPAAAPGQSYPRTYGQGENVMVDYGPTGQGALVGGGRVMVSRTAGMDIDILHLDAQFVQQPRPGLVPMSIGSGENQETVWVPAMMIDMVRRARAGMPGR